MRNWIKNVSLLTIGLLLLIGILCAPFFWATIVDPVILPNDTTIIVVEPNFIDIVAQSVKSVVHIKCPHWQGSGFIIDKHIICTARHVVEDCCRGC